jgi:Zn-dependent protease
MDVEHVRDGLLYLLALILSICVHEFGHAFIADKLGDPLPRAQGRVTLNPIPHIDPIGTLAMPLLAFAFPSFGAFILGWGKPVQVSLSPRSLTKRWSVRFSHLLIALAGPMMNLVFALVVSGVYLLLAKFGDGKSLLLTEPVAKVILMNIGLAFFNLIPCPPLDGGAILRGILPRSLDWISDGLEKYGSFVLLALLFTGAIRVLLTPAMFVARFWFEHLNAWAT